MRRAVTAVVAIGLLLSACSSTPEVPGPGPDIGGPSTSPSPSQTDEWAVPEVITEDYAIKVINELEREIAEFELWMYYSEPNERPPSDIVEHLHSAYVPELVNEVVNQYVEQYADGDRSGLLDPPGQYFANRVTLHFADPACPLLEVEWDSSEVETPDPDKPREDSMVIIVRSPMNVTGWVFKTVIRVSELDEGQVEDAVSERESSCGK